MARNLSIYLNPLSVEAPVELDGTDDRLNAIIEANDKGKWAEAADRAEDLADEGIFDIRPMSFVLYAAFREGGITVLESIYAVLVSAFGENAAAIGPQNNRVPTFNKRLVWLFGTILANLEYYKKVGGKEWQAILNDVSGDGIREAMDVAKVLAESLASDKYANAATSLAGLNSFVRTLADDLDAHAKAVAAPAAAPAESASAAAMPGAGLVDSDDDQSGPESEKPVAGIVSTGNGTSKRTMTLVVSNQFIDFVAKLRAFETLVEKGEHLKAAVVAEDLQNTLDNFDPRSYFPDLLSRFSELMCTHASELEEQMEGRGSFAWRASAQFYRVDLDKFVRGSGQ